jgi:type IV secretory pathway TraG/TraD family ATPase VirD4
MALSAFKGFEKWYTSIRMFTKMTMMIFGVLVIIHLLATLTIGWFMRDKYFGGTYGFCVAKTYYISKVASNISFGKAKIRFACGNEEGEVTYDYMESRYGNIIIRMERNARHLFFSCAWIYLLLPISILYFHFRNIRDTKDRVVRGAFIITPKQFALRLDDYTKPQEYRFAINSNISIPESIVTRHCFVIGKPGSGKSQLIYRVIEQLIARDYRCIIHDFKGDMISSFYDPAKHLIFNPCDTRHVGWNLFKELQSSIDVDAFCASLIPEAGSNDVFWPISARSLLNSIITYCLRKGKTTYEDLWKFVNMSNEELLPLLKGISGCEEGIKLLTEAKTANSIMAVLSNYTRPIKYLIGTDGDFSIKEWIRDANSEKRVIFLSNFSMLQDTIRPFMALFVDFATKTFCSLNDDLKRRLYFVLDEFGQIGKIGSIIQLLTQSRSKGGATWLLIQDVAQLNSIYGKDGATSIVNACGNTVSFCVADSDTAEFISKKIGASEIRRVEESASMGVSDMKDSISHSERIIEKRLVLPSEIMSLPTMNFYIQLTDLPVTRDSFTYRKYPQNCQSFSQRNDFALTPSAAGQESEERINVDDLLSTLKQIHENECSQGESDKDEKEKDGSGNDNFDIGSW